MFSKVPLIPLVFIMLVVEFAKLALVIVEIRFSLLMID